MTPSAGQVLGWSRKVRLEQGLCICSQPGVHGCLKLVNFAVVTYDVNIRGS